MPDDLRELCRGIFEARVGAQIAAERETVATRALVQKLVEMRQLRGWSIEYMAELVQMTRQYYEHVEMAVCDPRQTTVKKMVEAFGYQYPLMPTIFVSRTKAPTKKGTRKK